MAWIRSDLMPIREERGTQTMFCPTETKPLSAAGEAARQRVVAVADELVGDGRKTLFDQWCLADADFGFFLMRLVLHRDPMPDAVRAYAEAQWQRPSMRAFCDRPREPFRPY